LGSFYKRFSIEISDVLAILPDHNVWDVLHCFRGDLVNIEDVCCGTELPIDMHLLENHLWVFTGTSAR
jgi:hypothetical protein